MPGTKIIGLQLPVVDDLEGLKSGASKPDGLSLSTKKTP